MNLFESQEKMNRDRVRPLAARMRPVQLSEFTGQQHILGEGMLLRRMITADRLGSMIFYGPPGTGKTSLAEVIARSNNSFH
jgi:putative ATPase